ncbi:MAG: hypothetical protein ACE14Q_06825 [Acidobacteriota bacterium]
MDKGVMIWSVKKIILFIIALFSLFAILSCFKEYIERRDYRKTGGCFIILDSGKTFLAIEAKKSQNFYFKKKPSNIDLEIITKEKRSHEIEQNLLKTETVSACLDIVSFEGKKRELLFENFLKFNPKFCEGILEGASMELLKGEQNLGKMGLLLPLYKIGCLNPDWAILNIEQNKIYSLEAEGVSRKPLKLPLFSEGGGTIYDGERNFAIASPYWNLCATLSKKGKLVLLDENGKKLFEGNNINSFCFHPEKKLLYYGCEEGLMAYNWDEKRVSKLVSINPRLIRISKYGGYIFALKVGGENLPYVFKISTSGEKIIKEILIDDDTRKADDWIFSGDSTLLGIFNQKEGTFVVETNLESREKRVIESPKGFEIYLINSGVHPTIIAKSRKSELSEEQFYYYDTDLKKFEIATFPIS